MENNNQQDGKKSSGQRRNQRHHNRSNNKKNNKKRLFQGKRPSNSHQRRRSNRNRYASKLTSIHAVFSKYDNLLENYLNLRSKYFEYFHRDPSKQRTKVINNYFAALEQLRNFTKQLSKYQREQLEKRNFFRPDHTYSEEHNIDPELTNVELDEIPQDPHICEVQKNRPSYKDDTEESIGTIDDYKQYKGISE